MKGKFIDYDEIERYKVSSSIAGCSIKEFIPSCPLELIQPNKWNPNEQDDFQYSKTIESLKNNGFVHTLVVREIWQGDTFMYYELLDGEHRLRAAKTLGYETAPCNNLGIIPDSKAKKLSLILAANRGELNPLKLSKVLHELEQELSEMEFHEVPFTEEDLEKMKMYYDVSWNDVDISDVFQSQKEENRDAKKSKNDDMIRLSFSFRRDKKHLIEGMLDRYSIEHEIYHDKNDVKRGLVLEHILKNYVYSDSHGEEE